VARLLEREGLGDLIRAIGMLDREQCELEIAGAGPDELTLRQLAAGLGVSHRIFFSGTPDRDTLARRYRESDIFALPAREDFSGDVLVQALASGLPIVATNVGGISEMVEHGENGLLVPARDPAALASAIRHLVDQPDLRTRMGRENRANAEARLSWERIVIRYLSIYQGVQRLAPARHPLAEVPSSTW
jgi:glycosyltransferase involved in cell wall biosynthesis